MSNVLKVSLQTTIYSLADRGWSQRRIASELGINRETVRRYLRMAKPAISIVGSEEGADRKPAISITGEQAEAARIQNQHGGVFRELPILPFPTMSISLVRGKVVQWGAISQSVGAWTSGTNVALGVCVGDVDRDAQQVAFFAAKVARSRSSATSGSYRIQATFCFVSARGGFQRERHKSSFAHAVGVGFNGYAEAIVN